MSNPNPKAFPPFLEPHIPNAEEIEEEEHRKQREKDPKKFLGDETQQESFLNGESDWA